MIYVHSECMGYWVGSGPLLSVSHCKEGDKCSDGTKRIEYLLISMNADPHICIHWYLQR